MMCKSGAFLRIADDWFYLVFPSYNNCYCICQILSSLVPKPWLLECVLRVLSPTTPYFTGVTSMANMTVPPIRQISLAIRAMEELTLNPLLRTAIYEHHVAHVWKYTLSRAAGSLSAISFPP